MDYRDEVRAYQEEAEESYDNYSPEEDFDSGFEGNEDAYYDGTYDDEYDGVDPEYDNYNATSIGRIDPNDRTYTVVVKNASNAEAEAIIFGANEAAEQPAGITVSVEESSHNEVREESKSFPFTIVGMKYSVSDAAQFDSILYLKKRTASGTRETRVYQPRNATSPANFTQLLIDDSNFEMEVTGQHSIRVNVKPNVTAVFTFTVKARANLGNLLKGNNVAEMSTTPRSTGIPHFDLMNRRPSPVFGLKPGRGRGTRRPAPIGRRRPPRGRGPARPMRG